MSADPDSDPQNQPGAREFALIRRFIYTIADVGPDEDVSLVEAAERAANRLAELERRVESVESLASAEWAEAGLEGEDDDGD